MQYQEYSGYRISCVGYCTDPASEYCSNTRWWFPFATVDCEFLEQVGELSANTLKSVISTLMWGDGSLQLMKYTLGMELLGRYISQS